MEQYPLQSGVWAVRIWILKGLSGKATRLYRGRRIQGRKGIPFSSTGLFNQYYHQFMLILFYQMCSTGQTEMSYLEGFIQTTHF